MRVLIVIAWIAMGLVAVSECWLRRGGSSEDGCDPDLCENGGTCTDLDSGDVGFSCACPAAWTGTTCGTDVVDCTSSSCNGVGVCNEEVGGGVVCECDHGYSGDFCGTDIDDCSPNPCGNGATCVDGVDSFTCQCTAAWTGDICDTDIVECTSSSCNGVGVCNEEVGGGIVCECNHGYSGDFCGTDIDDCSPNPCGNGATCVDGVDSFTCQCTAAWTGDICDTDVVDCTSSSCSGQGTCLEVVGGGIQCVCDAGYTGNTDCTDVNECTEGTLVCGSNSNCVNTEGSAECACDPGFGGIDAPLSCTDEVSYGNAWVQTDIANHLVARNLDRMTELTYCFYFKGDGNNDYISQYLLTIASPGDIDQFRFGWNDQSILKLAPNPDANSVLTGAAAAAAVFDVSHRHCIVWSQGNFLKWFYDSTAQAGLLVKAADVADDGSPGIKNNADLIPLQEQDSVGGGLDAAEQVTGLISDIQVWNRALSDAEVVALGCEAEGNLLSPSDFTIIGTDTFTRTDEFFCRTIV